MSLTGYFKLASEKNKAVSVARLVKASTGDFDFYFFAILGVSMATFGLILNTPEVIIGSMLIAPVLYPLLSASLSFVLVDTLLMYRALRTLIITFGVAVLVSFLLTLFLGFFIDISLGEQVISRAQPSLLFFLVACISGFAATFALVQASLNEMLPGVAISVSLVPPLAVIGIGLGVADPLLASKAFMLFLLNVLGVGLSSILTFTIMELHGTHKVALSAIKQEERRLKKETEKMEDIINENNSHND